MFFKEVTDLEEPFSIEKTHDKINTYKVYHKPMGRVESYRFKKGIFRNLLLEIGSPDIIHLHILAADQLLFARYALKHKKPYFISEHWSGYVTEGFKNLPFYKQLLFKRLARRAKTILPVSKFLEGGMKRSGLIGNYHIVPNIVSIPNAYPPKNDHFTFIVVADMVDYIKNVSGIVKAFQKLELKNVQLILVGDGPDMENIQALAAKNLSNIFFKGRLSNVDALQEIAKSQCLIVNSFIETFSVVALEARAQGLHVISTSCGGPAEWADEDTHIIPLNKTDVLEETMRFVVTQSLPNKRDISDFSEKIIGRKLQYLYEH